MDSLKLTSELKFYPAIDDLNEADKELIKKAFAASEKAYAPYSNFFVGAAVRLSDGLELTGSNQENVAFPSGLCAERVVAFYAKALHPDKKINTIAIVAVGNDVSTEGIVSPCGSCRQALIEYEQNDQEPIRLLMVNQKMEVYESASVQNLLPYFFSSSAIARK